MSITEQCSTEWDAGTPGAQKTSTGPFFIAKTFLMQRKFEDFYIYIFLSLKKEKQGKKILPNI